MKTINKYLVVSGKGDVKVVSRAPTKLLFDSMYFPLNITIPDSWGMVYTDVPINLVLPEPGQAVIAIGQVELGLDVIIGDGTDGD